MGKLGLLHFDFRLKHSTLLHLSPLYAAAVAYLSRSTISHSFQTPALRLLQYAPFQSRRRWQRPETLNSTQCS